MGLTRSRHKMGRVATAITVAAIVVGMDASAWAADLVNMSPASSKATKAPLNMPASIRARYCEDTACELVTLRIWSGDTFTMDRLGQHHELITIADIEAADVHAQCAAEADAAQSAKRQLVALLEGRTFVLARMAGRKDARSTAFVTAGGRDVGKMMMDNHQARPYETPPRPWC